MMKELKVAAKNTVWNYIWLRAIYFDSPNTLECAIFHESLMCAYFVRNIVIEELAESGAEWLLNRSPEYIIDKYSYEYPELCLILCHLGPFGPLSPIGLCGDLRHAPVAYIFGATFDSPLYHADFYAKSIPVIRIKPRIFTLGTNQPQFNSVSDVENYYRDEARIEEIAKMCLSWIRKFYK